MRALRGEIQQRANGAGSLLARAQLQHLTEQHQRGDDCGSLEINGRGAVHFAERGREDLREDRRGNAVEKRSAGAEADQREHIGAAMNERGPETLEERPASPEHNRRREQQLDPVARGRDKMQAQLFAEHGEHKNGSERTALTQNRMRIESYSGSASTSATTSIGSSAMPQIGQAPGTELNDFGMHRAGVTDLSSALREQRSGRSKRCVARGATAVHASGPAERARNFLVFLESVAAQPCEQK